MAYSLDFRKRVFAIQKRDKLSCGAVCERFGISTKTLGRWKKRIEPKLKRNKPATKIDMDALAADVEKYPDAYQYERAERLGVSSGCVLYALRRLGISHKKNACPPEGGRGRTSAV